MDDTQESSKEKSGSDPGYKASWITKIIGETSSTTTQTETHAKPRIQKIPLMLRDTTEFEKYYVPRVVSLGPYHHDKPKLKFVQDLKPKITKKFVKGNKNRLDSLFDKLHGKIEEVRNYYEENSTAFIQQDLFLLEIQVPYMVLEELMSLEEREHWQGAIKKFIKNHNFMASERVQKRCCEKKTFSNCWGSSSDPNSHDKGKNKEIYSPAHLLELLQKRLVGKQKTSRSTGDSRYTFRNANELLTVGIRFKPSKTSCVADIQYNSCGFSAYLEHPTITVDNSTRPMLLNLVAYEMCSNVPNESWVTSYICFLDSLIDHTEDVKELRKAGILYNSLGSDEEVAKLFNEIGTDLVVLTQTQKSKIQKHYQSKRKTWATQFKHEYFKTPWSALALIGAIVVLFLSGVQAYFSVWSAPGECDCHAPQLGFLNRMPQVGG